MGSQSVALALPAPPSFPPLRLPTRAVPIGPDTAARRLRRQAIAAIGRGVLMRHPVIRIGKLLFDLYEIALPILQRVPEFTIPQTGGWQIHGACSTGAAFVFGTTTVPVPASEHPPLDYDCFSNQQAAPTAAGNENANKATTRHINYYGPMATRPGFEEKKLCVTRPSQTKQYRPHVRAIPRYKPAVNVRLDALALPLVGYPPIVRKGPKAATINPRMPRALAPPVIGIGFGRPAEGGIVTSRPNPFRAPREQTDRGHQVAPVPIKHIVREYMLPRVKTAPAKSIANQKLPEKESKVRQTAAFAAYDFARVIFNDVSEFKDFVMSLWYALPASARSNCTTLQCDLQDIYNNIDKIDWTRAALNILANQIQDYLFGQVGKANALASEKFGKILGRDVPVGFQRGWNDRQRMFDDIKNMSPDERNAFAEDMANWLSHLDPDSPFFLRLPGQQETKGW